MGRNLYGNRQGTGNDTRNDWSKQPKKEATTTNAWIEETNALLALIG